MNKFILQIALLSAVFAPAALAAPQSGKSRDDFKKDYVRPSSVPFPADNGYTPEKAHLGEMLFFDPRLSGSNWISCANCHNPSLAWGDGLPRGLGHGMKELGRRTPTILNLAWADLLMWDGRKKDLEEQALGPMTSPAEMHAGIDDVIAKLQAIAPYRTEFRYVFGDAGITPKTIGQAIATYERTIVSGPAPFDRWIAGEEGAISEAAKRGFDVFNGKGNCATCHSGWNFTDNSFRDIGMPDKDIGRGEWVKIEAMQQAFKTPTLRDIDRRSPYMHNGTMPTLAAVIDHYDRGGVNLPSLSEEIHPLHLTKGEKGDLLAFLATLSGDNPAVRIPVLFPNPQTASR
jgi:cytochrome c peroxidase